MKGLITAVLGILSVFIVHNTAMSQDPGSVDSLCFGNPDGSSIIVSLDRDYDIPIWVKCDENLAFMHFCLATENEYVPIRLEAYGEGPFLEWDLLGTLPSDGWPEEGLTSQSLLGIADFSLPEPNYINTDYEWLLVGGFRIHTTDNPDASGDLSPLLPGEDPMQGLTVFFDENWTPISPDILCSSLEFVVSNPPEIITPVDDTLIAINDLYPFSMQIEAVDPDTNEVTLVIEFPYDDYELTEIINVPGHINYVFDWTPPADCDTAFQANIIVTDSYGFSDTNVVNFDVRPLLISVSNDSTLPGYSAVVDVSLIQSGTNSNVGAFNLLFLWDNTIITFQNADFSDELGDWELLEATLNPLGPGSLRLLGVANVASGDVPPLTQGDHLLASLDFLASIDSMYQGSIVILDMPVDDMSNNVLSDSSGYLAFHPAIDEGSITILHYEYILIGDINLNLLPWETGDAVTFINHLIDPITNPFNTTQRLASDCNQDYIPETIADLIFLLNVIGGEGAISSDGDVPRRVRAGFAGLNIISDNNTVSVHINSESSAKGLLVLIDHANTKISEPQAEDNMILHYNDTGDVLTVLVYPSELSNSLTDKVFSFNVLDGDSDNVTIESYEISDRYGRIMQK